MTIDRAERTGLGVAVGGHVLLFAVLSAGFVATRPLPIERKPVEVSLVDETALESGAPTLSDEAPAPKLAEIEGPVEPTPPPPDPAVEPTPAPPTPKLQAPAPTPTPRPSRPQPKAAPNASPAPVAKAAPAKAKPTRPTGRLKGLLTGVSDADSPSQSTSPPAATITPAVQSALAAAVLRQLKPHWKAPSGADSEQLRTELSISLARDGSVTGIEFLRQTGITDSNRGQAQLHKENAIKAVRLAAPFQLPPKYYDAWKLLSPIRFDKRLSQ